MPGYMVWSEERPGENDVLTIAFGVEYTARPDGIGVVVRNLPTHTPAGAPPLTENARTATLGFVLMVVRPNGDTLEGNLYQTPDRPPRPPMGLRAQRCPN
jgi:hypothetical protein